MRKFKKAHRLPHDWASLVVSLRKFQASQDNQAKAAHGHRALEALTQLLEDCGDEIREALVIVSQADGTINTSRSQQIAQYHRNRIGRLTTTINEIDAALEAQKEHENALQVAELSSQRKDLEYQLKDHTDKIDKRSHGLHLTTMRRKHR